MRRELLPGAWYELYEGWLSPAEASHLMGRLCDEVPWECRQIEVFGRKVLQPRLTAWVGDPEAVYTYSRTRHVPLPWTPVLTDLQGRLEQELSHAFNSVLCNLYRDGQDSMGMHRDAEPELGPEPLIASLSLGATRRFALRPCRSGHGPKLDIELESGALLVMGGTTQRFFRHGVPKQPAVQAPRVNLTFRWVRPEAPHSAVETR